MRTVRTALAALTVAAALTGLNACGSSTTTPAPADAPVGAPSSSAAAPSSAPSATPTSSGPTASTGTLEAVDQDSDGTSVMVASVDLDASGLGGWIALHADAAGKPGPVKYFVAVPAGASSDIAIPTADGISSGDYWPMLHVDDGVIGTYEFPKVAKADLPAMSDKMVVMQKITVTVK